jgi:hypothetical protein
MVTADDERRANPDGGTTSPPIPTHQPFATYQDAFLTPGIIPDNDSSRKQIRHSPKRRRYARDRPQRPQRLCCRTANLGFRLLFSTMAFRAIRRLSTKGWLVHDRSTVLDRRLAARRRR